jgi:hypothetical protein
MKILICTLLLSCPFVFPLKAAELQQVDYRHRLSSSIGVPIVGKLKVKMALESRFQRKLNKSIPPIKKSI